MYHTIWFDYNRRQENEEEQRKEGRISKGFFGDLSCVSRAIPEVLEARDIRSSVVTLTDLRHLSQVVVLDHRLVSKERILLLLQLRLAAMTTKKCMQACHC